MSDAKAVSKGESSEPAKKPRFEVKKVCLSYPYSREIYDHAQLCRASDQVELDALVSYLREAEGKTNSQFMAEIHGDEGFFSRLSSMWKKREVFWWELWLHHN